MYRFLSIVPIDGLAHLEHKRTEVLRCINARQPWKRKVKPETKQEAKAKFRQQNKSIKGKPSVVKSAQNVSKILCALEWEWATLCDTTDLTLQICGFYL